MAVEPYYPDSSEWAKVSHLYTDLRITEELDARSPGHTLVIMRQLELVIPGLDCKQSPSTAFVWLPGTKRGPSFFSVSHTGVMGLTGILLAIIVVLTLIVVHYRQMAGKGNGGSDAPPSTWSAVKDSWAQLRGGVLNMVIAGNAGAASTEWVTDNAPHGKGGSMTEADADVVCEKACDGWGSDPSVAVFCDSSTKKAIDF